MSVENKYRHNLYIEKLQKLGAGAQLCCPLSEMNSSHIVQVLTSATTIPKPLTKIKIANVHARI